MTPHTYQVQDDPLFQQMIIERNLKSESSRQYKKALQNYCNYNKLTLTELYEEADQEEEKGVRAKNRKIIQRLRGFRTYLIQENYAPVTINGYYSCSKAFYRHYLIEIPYIPSIKLPQKQLMYEEMPHKEHILEALSRTSNPKHRAIIYFMVSSGTARNEVANITIQDFIDATKEYHNSTNIYDVVQELEKQDNIIPLFQLTRVKTNFRYYTCCTPEATKHILRYLRTRPLKRLRPQQTLFNVKPNSITIFFSRLATKCGYPTHFLHPHALRKHHATTIGDYDLANMLEGRKQTPVREAYFKAKPSRVKEEYMKHIEDLTLKPVRMVTIESDEVKKLKRELRHAHDVNKKLQSRVESNESDIKSMRKILDSMIKKYEEE